MRYRVEDVVTTVYGTLIHLRVSSESCDSGWRCVIDADDLPRFGVENPMDLVGVEIEGLPTGDGWVAIFASQMATLS